MSAHVFNLVTITAMCQQFNCLPKPGGLLDQDCYLVIGMQFVLSAQNEKQQAEIDREKDKK